MGFDRVGSGSRLGDDGFAVSYRLAVYNLGGEDLRPISACLSLFFPGKDTF